MHNLKVARHLFTWTKEMAYADYYEGTLTNGVIGIQRGREPGVMIYMLPLNRGNSKAVSYHGWGTRFNSFWCCYGTGIESFTKLGDSIYFEEQGKVPGLYIIQFISSTINWQRGQFSLYQNVDPYVSWDPFLRLTLTVTSSMAADQSSLILRIPSWTLSSGSKATLDGQSLPVPAPGNFLPLTKKWSSGDKLTLELPITLRTEPIKDDRPEYASLQATLFGPYLLAGHTNGDWDIKAVAGHPPSEWLNSNVSGTEAALQATFRIILTDPSAKFSSIKDIIEKSIALEPIAFPGMLVAQLGKDHKLIVQDASSAQPSTFILVPGLDGKDTVSLESETQKGCFVISGKKLKIKLSCNTGSSDAKFNNAASFVMGKGMSEYHPISFVAKGVRRNFLLEPLYNFKDESYTVYFNMKP
ncbi:hypothetical protein Pint_31152 [Pistacia integerrima]|uniref:Uncharacterized protein n=1 Tax=Pistacia integerrima TaxID=434235 RepID=A0ACC0XM27_9ROSI|nr:hypothetical protein Pint_31152 [Pistacia integerrima]